ncbi:L10-interacting MYB domain-containing protein [Cinnamomum micranthum f. kanehirae]|uniref:L10-interacting MYB domain-containing protein n=1 Tax=Cinnamomum micranthum f. kanehirae TaxID=337451 RepID=A0A3S3PUN0_9MAGN|nr:L10-interacting MYB domain-containing protein [Cinnamomum micranthum f. kanehirae]
MGWLHDESDGDERDVDEREGGGKDRSSESWLDDVPDRAEKEEEITCMPVSVYHSRMGGTNLLRFRLALGFKTLVGLKYGWSKGSSKRSFRQKLGASIELAVEADYRVMGLVNGQRRVALTPSHDSFAVGFLVEQKKLGRFSDNGFKKEVWKKCLDELNKRFDISVTPTQLKSHMADLQKRYRIVKSIREQSGFGWDDLLHMCTADDDVWNRYIKAHP